MRTLCIYAKPPLPGRTKRRLARTIGERPAAELAAAMLSDLCGLALEIDAVDVQLWHPPEVAPQAYADVVPGSIVRCAQRGNHLGERMAATFDLLLREENQQVVLVGSDCVTFTSQLFEAAFQALERLPVVIQPADDGGYVLVGQSKPTPKMFHDIAWGTDQVLCQTWQRLREAGVPHCELPLTFDVDQLSDLPKLLAVAEHCHRPALNRWLNQHGDLLKSAG